MGTLLWLYPENTTFTRSHTQSAYLKDRAGRAMDLFCDMILYLRGVDALRPTTEGMDVLWAWASRKR